MQRRCRMDCIHRNSMDVHRLDSSHKRSTLFVSKREESTWALIKVEKEKFRNELRWFEIGAQKFLVKESIGENNNENRNPTLVCRKLETIRREPSVPFIDTMRTSAQIFCRLKIHWMTNRRHRWQWIINGKIMYMNNINRTKLLDIQVCIKLIISKYALWTYFFIISEFVNVYRNSIKAFTATKSCHKSLA